MDKLAVELLTLIAFYACTDGGRTGSALALVSKRIHYASRPARFYSVSLINSSTQMDQFLTAYKQERARYKDVVPRVRHLCLSFFGRGLNVTPTPAAAPSAPAMTSSREAFLAAQRQRAQQWNSAQNNLDGHYNRVIPELIRLVAPDLVSLALIQAQWRSATVLRCQFSCLQELTLVGGDPSFLPFNFVPSDRPLYPALRRLHHIFALVNKDVDFLQWAQHAPNITHLRVSRMDYFPRITVDTLEQVMSKSAPEKVFPKLGQVVIQPHPGPPPNTSGRLSTIELSFRDFLAHLRKSAQTARVPVMLLEPMPVPKGVAGGDPSRGCILRLEGEWITRIEGGEGCWGSSISEPQEKPDYEHGGACWATTLN